MNPPTHDYVGALVSTNVVPLVTAVGATIASRGLRGPAARERWTRWWLRGSAVGAVLVALSFFAIPRYMATSMGYLHSPYQFEVAVANLGFAAGLLWSARRPELRGIAVLGYTVFMWGALGGHVYQFLVNGNDTSGNVPGIWVYDLVMPLVAVLLVRPWRSPTAGSAGS